MQHPVIIIGGGSANGLGIARSLGGLGIPIYCVTSDPHELTLYSRYCTRGAVVPDIERNPSILLSFLTRLSRQLPTTGVLFPTTDTALLTVSAIRDALEHYVTFIPDQDLVATMVIKTRFYQALRAHHVPHPITLLPEDESWDAQLQDITFPIYIRPAQSLLFYEHFRAKGFVAQNPRDLHIYLQTAQEHRIPVMLQEIIPGPTQHGVTLRGYMDAQGRVLALMATQKIRQPSLFSNVTVNRTVSLTRVRVMQDILLTFLRAIQYRGLFGAEFKHDARDGIPKLLEINARSLGANYFATQCGYNHVLTAYRDALQKPVTPLLHYTSGVYKIHLIHDLTLLLRHALKRRVTFTDLYPYFEQKVMQIYVDHDPLPFLSMLRQVLTLRALAAAFHRITPC
jgi:predicted ATP-grasp superfamily ATP-dependent carboligase